MRGGPACKQVWFSKFKARDRRCDIAGHSKWAQIKHQKGAADKRRGSVFSKLSRAIAVSAREGADPETNFQLRLAIDKAKSANVPKDNIERVLQRARGKLDDEKLQTAVYEAYGPYGTATVIDVITDNKNRTIAEIKGVLNKFEGKLAEVGAVKYLFERKGELRVEGEKGEEIILESGAEDYQKIEGGFLVYCPPRELAKVREFIRSAGGGEVRDAELVWQSKATVSLSGEDSRKVLKLLEALDELDDVAGVSSNLG